MTRFSAVLLLLFSTAARANTDACDNSTEHCVNGNSMIVSRTAITQMPEANEVQEPVEIIVERQEVEDANATSEAANLETKAEWGFDRRRRSPPSPPPAPPPPPLAPYLIDMAKIASAVYNLGDEILENVDGWTLDKWWIQTSSVWPAMKDQFALYKRDGNTGLCALAAAGTNDVADIIDDLDVMEMINYCGVSVTAGFKGEVDDLLTSSAYTDDFEQTLQNCDNVYITGHSLGGAIASVLTACAVNDDVTWGAKFAGLYTIGAPGVTTDQIKGKDDACLPGVRIFNNDDTQMDPVPYVGRLRPGDPLLHQKLPALQLKKKFYDQLSTVQYNCDATNARDRPTNGIKGWASNDHKAGTYISRLEESFNQDANGVITYKAR